jgi:peptide/nickel transport system ATP-binding protein
MSSEILKIANMDISFYEKDVPGGRNFQAVHHMNLCVHSKEVVAVIGASGSGKSLLAHAVLGILPSNARMTGEIMYNGHPLDAKSLKKHLGREIVFIPQSLNYLDPRMKAGAQIRGVYGTEQEMNESMERYGLGKEVAEEYPFQLSGGMARRVLFAATLQSRPSLIIADEPTPGMTILQAMQSLGDLRMAASGGAGVLLITHDITLAVRIADRIAVTYNGQIVEEGESGAFTGRGLLLQHPFTKALWMSLPQNDFISAEGLSEWN